MPDSRGWDRIRRDLDERTNRVHRSTPHTVVGQLGWRAWRGSAATCMSRWHRKRGCAARAPATSASRVCWDDCDLSRGTKESQRPWSGPRDVPPETVPGERAVARVPALHLAGLVYGCRGGGVALWCVAIKGDRESWLWTLPGLTALTLVGLAPIWLRRTGRLDVCWGEAHTSIHHGWWGNQDSLKYTEKRSAKKGAFSCRVALVARLRAIVWPHAPPRSHRRFGLTVRHHGT